jgi:fructosamine-3-kinase
VNEALRAAIGAALGARVTGARALAGGDINEAFAIELSDGQRAFAKTNAKAPAGFFEAEARGLGWLEAAGALRIPKVLGLGAASAGHGPFLLLELLEPGVRMRGFDEILGRGLALLHRSGAPGFGLDHDNFVGALPQSNQPAATWAEFYRERRLRPLLERARRHGLASAALGRNMERLFAALEERVGPSEPPARLHGDLWAGNLHADPEGQPVLIDPAVYGGHREMDLAMMRLFGGFGERVFAAYDAAYPLAAGHRERVALYQLYPLLVHVALFGAGYVGQLEACLARLL